MPICKDAKEEDVLTTCFREFDLPRCGRVVCANPRAERDSAKDEAVVFIFIFATVGLLIYASVRPWVEKWTEVRVTET